MLNLPLAVNIADTVSRALRDHNGLDVEIAAYELLYAHPEAEATQGEIVDVLLREVALPERREPASAATSSTV